MLRGTEVVFRRIISIGVIFWAVLPALGAEGGKPSLNEILKPAKCRQQVHLLLHEWGSLNDFTPQLTTLPGMRVYASPTDKIGRWVEVQMSEDFTVEARRVTSAAVTRVAWNLADCAPALAVSRNSREAGVKGVVDDERLEAFIRKNPNALIYAWSPQMPHSVKGLETIQQVGKRLNMKVLTVLDPRADLEQARRDSRMYGKRVPASLDRIESVELFYRNMTIHYPAVLIVHRGKVTGPMLPGLTSTDQYVEIIKRRLK